MSGSARKTKSRNLSPEETYRNLLRLLIQNCPRSMRAVALLADNDGVEVVHSCCEGCGWGLIHYVADGDQRVEDEAKQVH